MELPFCLFKIIGKDSYLFFGFFHKPTYHVFR